MRHNRFTLVELLVVICIASLLMGVVLPAFSRMVTGSAVDRLASNLKLRLERAQSHAASSRRHVALILPHGTNTTWTDSKEQAARLGGSRMCYVDVNEDLDTTFKRWVPDEDWNLPESGACLVYVSKDDPVDDKSTSDPDDDTLKSAVITGTGRKIAQQVDSVLTDETSGNDKPLKSVASYNRTASAKSNCAVVFSPKGGVRSAGDVYLVIHEAMRMPEGALLYPGGGTQFTNFRVLKINRLTGKVEYHR